MGGWGWDWDCGFGGLGVGRSRCYGSTGIVVGGGIGGNRKNGKHVVLKIRGWKGMYMEGCHTL